MSDSLWPPWTAAHQDSLSITNPQSLLKLMSIESVMPSNLLILCRPLLLPSVFTSIRVFFPMSWLFKWGGQSIGASASALPVNIQSWFLLRLTGLISLLSKGLSRVLPYQSSPASILQHSALFMVQLSHLCIYHIGDQKYLLNSTGKSFEHCNHLMRKRTGKSLDKHLYIS